MNKILKKNLHILCVINLMVVQLLLVQNLVGTHARNEIFSLNYSDPIK